MQFTEFAKTACKLLANQGLWADFIDPCSGLPVGAPPPPPFSITRQPACAHAHTRADRFQIARSL